MNKQKTRKLSLHRETLRRMEEVELARAVVAQGSGETDVTVCRTREWSSCCPPTGTLES